MATFTAKVLASKDDAQEKNKAASTKTSKKAVVASATTTGTWTTTEGTVATAISKTTTEAEGAPATTPNAKTVIAKSVVECKFTIPAEIKERLEEAGSKIIKLAIYWNINPSANTGGGSKIGFKTPKEKFTEMATVSGQKWQKTEYTTAEAETVTKAQLEALTGICEKGSNAKELIIYEAYIEVEVEVIPPAPVAELTTTTTKMDNATTPKWGCRFTNVEIPNKATIISAVIKVWLTAGTKIEANIAVSYEDSMSEYKAEVNQFLVEGGAHSWEAKHEGSVGSLVKWETGSPIIGNWNTSPNFHVLMADTIARPGWKSGNAFGVMVLASSGMEATIENYDGNTAHAAELIVEYAKQEKVTVSIAQGQAISTAKASSLAKSVTQPQEPRVPKQANLVRPLITQGSTVGFVKLPKPVFLITQAQAPVLGNRQIGKPYPLVQTVVPIAAKIAYKIIPANQSIIASETVQVGKPIAVQQSQTTTFGKNLAMAIKAIQAQVIGVIKAFPRYLQVEQFTEAAITNKGILSKVSTVQNQNISYGIAGAKFLSTAQNQNVANTKQATKSISVGQGQIINLAKLQERILSVIQEVIASPSRKAIAKTIAVVQEATPNVFKRIAGPALKVVQSTIIFIQEPRHVEIRNFVITQAQNVSFGKFTGKVVNIVQPITAKAQKFIPKSLTASQGTITGSQTTAKPLPYEIAQEQTVSIESRVLGLFRVALSIIQNVVPSIGKRATKNVSVQQATQVEVSKGFLIRLGVLQETILETAKGFFKRFFLNQPTAVEVVPPKVGRHPSAGQIIWIMGEHELVRVESTLRQFEGEVLPGTSEVNPDKLLFTLRKKTQPVPAKKGTTRDPQWN